MPKPEKYELQTVLELRARTRENHIQILGQCRLELAAAETELAAREKSVEVCRRTQSDAQTAMLEKARGVVKNSEMLFHRQYLIDLRERETELLAAVAEQTATVKRAAHEVETALDALREANKELRMIEKHRENWARERKREATRQEQKSNDEIGAILHERLKDE